MSAPPPGPPPPDAPTSAYQKFYAENIALIDAVCAHACRRHHALIDERDDFTQDVHVRLIENDYRKLRQYRGKSTLRTYLDIVIERMFLDVRNHNWGKWRPSLPARQHGPVGVWLEQYTMRDHVRFEEAVQLLRTRHAVELSERELREIYIRFPLRRDRRSEPDDQLCEIPDGNPAPDALLEEATRQEFLAGAFAVLQQLLLHHPPEDRRLVRLRFIEGMKMKGVARLLGIANEKPLYYRCETILHELERELRAAGVDPVLLGFDGWHSRRKD